MEDRYIVEKLFPPMPIPNVIPSYIPKYNSEINKMLKNALNTYIYIWYNGNNISSYKEGFWFYPTKISGETISGYKWSGNHWEYINLSLNRIISYY